MLGVPAAGSVFRNDVTVPPPAVVGLQVTQTLTGQAVHGHVTGPAETPGLLGPPVHHTTGKPVARQELAGVGLISCGGEGRERTLVFRECVCAPVLSPGAAEECLILMRSSAAGLH